MGVVALRNSSRIVPVKVLGSACAGAPMESTNAAAAANRIIDFSIINLSLYNPTG
jgi:hypothetical protein